jgi:hypothetical protein
MSYHNLHLLRYRRPPESNISKENHESGSDHNHNINNNNPNKQHMLPSSSSTVTILTNIQNRNRQQQYKHSKPLQTKDETKHSRIWFFTNCCRTKTIQQQAKIDKRSSSTISSKATASNNILVDYCTYHDVAVSRVTCV